MTPKTLKALIEDAASRGADVRVVLGSECITLLPLEVRDLATGELEVRVTSPALRNSPPVTGQTRHTPALRSWKETWTIVPEAVHAACVMADPTQEPQPEEPDA